MLLTLVMHLTYIYFRLAAIANVMGKTCEAADLKADFEIERYMGTWFDFARSNNIPFQDGDCGTAQYKLLDDGTVDVVNTQYLPVIDELDGIKGSAFCSKYVSGKCGVKFNTL